MFWGYILFILILRAKLNSWCALLDIGSQGHSNVRLNVFILHRRVTIYHVHSAKIRKDCPIILISTWAVSLFDMASNYWAIVFKSTHCLLHYIKLETLPLYLLISADRPDVILRWGRQAHQPV